MIAIMVMVIIVAKAADTTIPLTSPTRDDFKDYVRKRSSDEGRDMTYDDVLRELLIGVGWIREGARRP